MRGMKVGAVAAALAAGAALVVGTPAVAGAATGTSCAQRWGSLAEDVDRSSTGTVAGVRAGRHTCYDRLVVDVQGSAAGYDVRYVPQVVTEGKGDVVPLRGGARLQVVVKAPAYDSAGRATFVPRSSSEVVGVAGYRTLRQVAWAGSFEGQTTLGVGVRARLPFRVFVLDGPGTGSRVVVDVAHRW